MPLPPEELKKGDGLTADWLNQLLRFARSCRLKVDPTSGLTGSVTADGTAISLQPGPDKMIGRLTTALTARSGSTPGSGTVQPYFGTAAAITSYGPTLTIYNWTASTGTTGMPVKFEKMYNLWWYDGNDCTTGATFP